ncbi:hypothetical protein C7974DRAFT_378177 [Boeremia exigua]|uniref:uncharacterized protein n=1 Tax=Boeremia exigua TaxID=749465 RepID=UPI001E8E04A4|nr:uncharacterized protein C7974DRAFT_378177 [Boeremia exigua]KAH6620053.1 hypothetical protein C7974DRAFT_378177 [Boeremia exigua]
MHFSNVLAASLAIFPAVFAQSNVPATSPIYLNGFYTITSVGDNTILALESGDGVFSLTEPATKNSTWYINSGPSGHAFIANARRGGVLTGVKPRDDSNPFNSQVQVQDVATDDQGRRRQAWALIRFDDGTYEIKNEQFDQLLDIRGGVGQGPEVILWTRNQPPSGNQRWNINLFSLTT